MADVADVLALHEQCYITRCREYSIRDSVDDAISTSVPCPIKTIEHGGGYVVTVQSLAAALDTVTRQPDGWHYLAGANDTTTSNTTHAPFYAVAILAEHGRG